MTATTWTTTNPTATAYTNSRSLPNLGVTLNATAYTMNDAVATMNDETPNPIYAGATTFTKQSTSATTWTKS